VTFQVADPFPADTGCEESPSCLSCPLPMCVLDVPSESKRREKAEAQEREVVRLRDEGMTAPEIARALGVSVRQVYRRLKRGNPVAAGEARS
jgi:hypothetical protein